MKRMLFAVLMVMTSLAHAQGGGSTTTICAKGSPPDCVSPNWGHINPDETDAVLAPRSTSPIASDATAARPQMAMQLLPVAAHGPQLAAPVKTVVSPINLFPRETLALKTAIRRARFAPDGSVVSGEAAITAAAAAAARRAGDQYTLTLYIKVPEKLRDDESGLLDKKVRSINELLGKAAKRDPNGPPKS